MLLAVDMMPASPVEEGSHIHAGLYRQTRPLDIQDAPHGVGQDCPIVEQTFISQKDPPLAAAAMLGIQHMTKP